MLIRLLKLVFSLFGLDIGFFKLAGSPRAEVFMKKINKAEAVTTAMLGVITKSVLKNDDTFKSKLEALSVWIYPHLCIIQSKRHDPPPQYV